MKLHEKLLAIQTSVDTIIKDGKNVSDKYDFASDENVLAVFRPLMDAHGLLLIPRVVNARLHEGATRSGTARFLTELDLTMTWYDVETGDTLDVPWYAQGVDLAGEKGVGKALTYGEKYFLLKFFHVGTSKDDPDRDARTGSGEKAQRGTAAAKETVDYQRRACAQIISEICGADETKARLLVLSKTKADARGYAGVETLAEVTDAALPVLYAKLKKTYEVNLKKPFELAEEDGAAG